MPMETYWTFAALLLAGRKIAIATGAAEYAEAIAELVENGNGLKAALRDAGLAPLAREMERLATEALAFTHPGPARDDAEAIFWQVAPVALADRDALAAANLDPRAACDRMVAAIKASSLGPDFSATTLAERYFREVTVPLLNTMITDAAYMTGLTPALWREILGRQGVSLEFLDAIKDDTTEILALVRELHAVKRTTVHEDTLIAMARKIRPRVADREEALRDLERAADIAAEQMERGHPGSNVDTFVDGVLRRLAEMTEAGQLDAAATAADDAVDRAEAGLTQLLNAAINQHLLAYDAVGAARQITKRLTLETTDPAGLFDALRREQEIWYERGRDRGLRLDLEIAISLARTSHEWASEADQRGTALGDLGAALQTLGARETGTARLEEAVGAYRSALKERTCNRVPFEWAKIQTNLGNALTTLGERETGTTRLKEAVVAYRDALKEQTRDRAPLDWAITQNNLGNALRGLGQRESGNVRLEQAVTAYRNALEEWTRDRVPLQWAGAHTNLGNALTTLGLRETGTGSLEKAVAAYRDALKEQTRDRVPLDWAMTQNNLGNTFWALGARGTGTVHLVEAVAAIRDALKERTRDRVPLDWAMTQANLALAAAEIDRRTDGDFSQPLAAIDGALEVFRKSGAAAYIEQGETIRRSITDKNRA